MFDLDDWSAIGKILNENKFRTSFLSVFMIGHHDES